MCEDCGCEKASEKYFETTGDKQSKIVEIEQDVLKVNNEIAHRNYHWFDDNKVRAINLISSPGSGKTALLEKTLEMINDKIKMSILVGDQQTDHDAQRLLNKGGDVKQINTYSSCHLDAKMISNELGTFVTGKEDLLIIENIGNLVCPAAFDLGEKAKIALLSTTEGEDKPIKYPVLFHNAKVILITKTDLIPHLDWSMKKTRQYIKQINPTAKVIALSAKTGEGMDQWCDYLIGASCSTTPDSRL